jgi:serine/threonine protein phosphatase PrpC
MKVLCLDEFAPAFGFVPGSGSGSKALISGISTPRPSLNLKSAVASLLKYQQRTGKSILECLAQAISQINGFREVRLSLGSELTFAFPTADKIAKSALNVIIPRESLPDLMSLLVLESASPLCLMGEAASSPLAAEVVKVATAEVGKGNVIVDNAALELQRALAKRDAPVRRLFADNLSCAIQQQRTDESGILPSQLKFMVRETMARSHLLDEATHEAEPGKSIRSVSVQVSTTGDYGCPVTKNVPVYFAGHKVRDSLVGVAVTKGLRPTNEDQHVIAQLTLRAAGKALPAELYAVLDGHGGKECSAFIKANLKGVLRQCFNKHNAKTMTLDNINKALEEMCHTLRNMFLKSHPEAGRAGTTGAILLKLPKDVFIINVGDSRIVAFDTVTQQAVQLTEDAKPGMPRYDKKIRASGGTVVHSCGCMRVGGALAVAGSFGVGVLPGIDAAPVITHMSREEAEEKAIVLACDGLTEHIPEFMVNSAFRLTSSVVGNIAAQMILKGKDMSTIARDLTCAAIQGPQASTDNVSVIVVAGTNMKPIAPMSFAEFEAAEAKKAAHKSATEAMLDLDLSMVRCREGNEFVFHPSGEKISTLYELLDILSISRLPTGRYIPSAILWAHVRNKDFFNWFKGSFDTESLLPSQVEELEKVLRYNILDTMRNGLTKFRKRR